MTVIRGTVSDPDRSGNYLGKICFRMAIDPDMGIKSDTHEGNERVLCLWRSAAANPGMPVR